MRVCVLTTSYPRHAGDASGAFVHSLLRTLAEHHDVEAVVVAPHEAGLARRERVDGVEVRRFQYTWPASLQRLAYGAGIPDNIAQSFLAKCQVAPFLAAFLPSALAAARDAELIHANWVETACVGLIAARAMRKPLVTTVHSVAPAAKMGGLYRAVLSRSDYVLFNSSHTASLAKAMGVHCTGEVLCQGVDVERFGGPRTGASRQQLGVEPDDILVVSVGRLIECKGHLDLVRAAARCAERQLPIKFAIAGAGPEEDRLREAIRSQGLEDVVRLLGSIPTYEVPALLSGADIYAGPSIVDSQGRTEAMGIAVAEAMAAGLPCVVSRTGGPTDLVQDGVTGYLVEPGNVAELSRRIEELAADADLRAKMGQAASARARDCFSWKTIARRTAAVYDALLSRRLPGPGGKPT